MRRLTKLGIALLLITLCLPTALAAQQAAKAARPSPGKLTYLERLPPLLERELFFGDPEIANSQLSPDGNYMTFVKPYQDVMNIWIKRVREPFDAARPLTADKRPVPGYFWSEDAKYVLYVQDKDGNEDYHVYAVDPTAKAEESTGVPPARDLTPAEGARAFIYAVPEGTPGQILVGLNDRDPALHDVYRVDLATGERKLLIQNDSNVAAWVADLQGDVRLAVRQTPDGGTEILPVTDGKLGAPIYTCSWMESCSPIRFHKDGKRVYLISNKGDDVDLAGLYLMDAATGKTTFVESDPEKEVDFGGAIFSDASEELIGTAYVGDRTRIYPKTEALKNALAFLGRELPDGEIDFEPQTNDDRLVKVIVSRDVDPGTVYLYDWEKNTVEKLYESRPELPTEHLAEMQPVRYPARDGLAIPAYLTVPKGVEAKNLALVVLPHGGPWARDTWGYDSLHQFLANRGYAVLSPNFRASTGYGKSFLNAGNREWGEAMQDDISDGVAHLVKRGIADSDRVCIMGGSYGGYATLAGVTFTPELYACGVDIVGPSNLITLLNSIPPYWGPIRTVFMQRMGDPSTEQGKKQLEAQSPLFSVDRIEDPLLVIQGANDPRVKQAEADQIVVAMREKGLPVEYVVAPDEGHGFRGEKNRLAMFTRVEQFLAEHLGGRHQESMAPEVATRLREITVDVASVEKPKAATGLDAAKTTPLPAVSPGAVREGSLAYSSSLTLQGREMTIESSRTVEEVEEEGETLLKVTSVSTSPMMGEARDVYLLHPESLRPVRRDATQGPATIAVEYGAQQVTGKIAAGPQNIPVEIDLEAPVFGADAAFDTVLTALPLAEAYRTTVRVAEVGMQQRVRYFSLAVTGKETAEVPAGSFETYRVEVEALDGEGGGQTSWVTTATPRVIVKTESKLPPQMGGATVTTVLAAKPE
jgi:dipeptidyl aminopeptidase/acylaminoacyl peptidase